MNKNHRLSALLALSLLCPSCATCYCVDYIAKCRPDQDGRYDYQIAAVTAVFWLPASIVWDGLTFPFQYFLGYNPFGEKGKYIVAK